MFLNDREQFDLTAREWTEIYAVSQEEQVSTNGEE